MLLKRWERGNLIQKSMSAIASYHSHDYVPCTTVPVIASFDSEGHIKPLYVRLGEEAYKIENCWLRSECVNVFQYNCRIVDENLEKTIILSYYQDECVWTVKRKM